MFLKRNGTEKGIKCFNIHTQISSIIMLNPILMLLNHCLYEFLCVSVLSGFGRIRESRRQFRGPVPGRLRHQHVAFNTWECNKKTHWRCQVGLLLAPLFLVISDRFVCISGKIVYWVKLSWSVAIIFCKHVLVLPEKATYGYYFGRRPHRPAFLVPSLTLSS